MIKAIVRDVFFLSQKSEPATKEDAFVIQDLLDTLEANRDRCVGMAANMIGVKKNIIVINIGMINMAMVNARIIKKASPTKPKRDVCLWTVCERRPDTGILKWNIWTGTLKSRNKCIRAGLPRLSSMSWTTLLG